MGEFFDGAEPAETMESTKQKTADENPWINFREDRSLTPIDRIWAFTDGSTLGYHSAVLVIPKMEVMYLSAYKPKTRTRNVGAELNGLLLALEHIPEGSDVAIVSDYLGIGAWMIGAHNINDEEVRTKIDQAQELAREKGLFGVLQFVHHGGHQRDTSEMTLWNTVADRLCSNDHGRVVERWQPWNEIEVTKIGLIKAEKDARVSIAACSQDKKKPKSTHWKVIAKPKSGVWYDWMDPKTSASGKCLLGDGNDGWHKAPQGEEPVILVYVGPKKAST